MASSAQAAPLVSDEEAVRCFRETGCDDCFKDLFLRYRKKVFLACHGFFADSATAEDATQETFLRVYQRIESFESGNFVAWLMRIAKNVCIDEWRKRRPDQVEEGGLESLPGSSRLTSSSELGLAMEKLWQEMSSLPVHQRRCLEMKIEGYSYEETAARTGLTLDAVKSHLQNGRRMLWSKMEGTLTQLR